MKFLLVSSAILLILYLIAATSCLKSRRDISNKGYEVFEWYLCFSPKKIFSVMYGFTLKLLMPEHIFEQMVLRKYDSYCRPNCLIGNNGHCDKCFCDTEAKMNSPFETCARGMWGKMILGKKAYKEHRTKYPIEILTRYKNE